MLNFGILVVCRMRTHTSNDWLQWDRDLFSIELFWSDTTSLTIMKVQPILLLLLLSSVIWLMLNWSSSKSFSKTKQINIFDWQQLKALETNDNSIKKKQQTNKRRERVKEKQKRKHLLFFIRWFLFLFFRVIYPFSSSHFARTSSVSLHSTRTVYSLHLFLYFFFFFSFVFNSSLALPFVVAKVFGIFLLICFFLSFFFFIPSWWLYQDNTR